MRGLPHGLQAGWLHLREALHLQEKKNWWKGGSIVFLILLGTFAATKILLAAGTSIAPGWVDKLLLIIAGYAMALAGALTQGIVICIDLAIRLMMYNGFVTSPVVGAGWSIVRDAMNMFFVIVLIAIAVMTIFGRSKINWQQQVPRLLLFAIVINFSRTLCGIMIDLSQVVMMTFANALRNIAAGNFIQMFGLNEVYLISQSSETIQEVAKTSQAPVAYDWFAAGILAVFMVIMVLSVVLALVAILAWRIVTLWVLVTISPLTWFMGGVSGVFSQAKGYTEWWTRFICATAIGPVITFFLWLTLAVAGAGSLAARGGFVSTTEQSNLNVSGNLSAIFQVENLISFVLGMGMLYAGFEAASAICSGGFVGQAMDKAKGVAPGIARGLQKQAKAAGGAAAGLGLKGARKLGAGVKAAGGRIGRDVGEAVSDVRGLKYFTKKGRAGLYRSIARRTRGRGILGRAVSERADIWGEQLEQARMAEVKEVGKGFEGMTMQSKVNALLRQAKGRTGTAKLKAQNLFMELAATEEGRKQLSMAGITEDFWKKNGAEMSETFKNDPEAKGKLDAFKKARVDLSGKKWTEALTGWSDVTALDPEALEALVKTHGQEAVQKHLESIGSDKKGVNAWQSLVGYTDRNGEEIKSSNLNAQAILTQGATARGIRFASASAQDLANITDEDLAANVTEKGMGNTHIRERILRSRSVGRITDTRARGAVSSAMGIDVAGGKVDGEVASAALAENPHLLGVLDHDAMSALLESDEGMAAASSVVTKKNQKQIMAAAKSDPKGSKDLLTNYARVLEARASHRDATDAHRGDLDKFVTQWRGMHATEIEALRQAKEALERATQNLDQATQNRDQVAASTQQVQTRLDNGTSTDEAADRQLLSELEQQLQPLQTAVKQLEEETIRLETTYQSAQGVVDTAAEPLVNGLQGDIQKLSDQIRILGEQKSGASADVVARVDQEIANLGAERQKLVERQYAFEQKMTRA
jgi:hypothetical protein